MRKQLFQCDRCHTEFEDSADIKDHIHRLEHKQSENYNYNDWIPRGAYEICTDCYTDYEEWIIPKGIPKKKRFKSKNRSEKDD